MFRLGMQPADKTSFKQLISSLINTMAEPSCVYNVPTTVGEIQFFDFGLNRTEAQKHCEDRSSILAPIKTQKVFDEIKDHFVSCSDENGVLQRRKTSHYSIGLRSVNGIGTWSDGTPFDANLHDSVALIYRPGYYAEDDRFSYKDSKEGSNETCRAYYYRAATPSSSGVTLSYDGCHYWDEKLKPFLCMIPSSPSSSSGSSSSVIIIVLILLLVPIIVSLGICYMKRDWIKNKVKGVSTEEE